MCVCGGGGGGGGWTCKCQSRSMTVEMLGNVASYHACFEEQVHLWVLAALFRPL